VEVDFVLYGPNAFWAIEVKNGSTVRREDTRSLRALTDDYPECRPLLLYRGRDRILLDRVLAVPVAEFLRALRPGFPLIEEP
jgi:hypothetical protein